VEENLLHPHKTLPIGEFAIGTNTMAYRMARKYDIMHLLPILIIEKMGPHFAIGDTCYSHEEDFPHHNIESKKLIIAVDNEKSAKRNEIPCKHIPRNTPISPFPMRCWLRSPPSNRMVPAFPLSRKDALWFPAPKN
jgi:hypothetical protein